eukprot:350444-Chlamydomonas_euryale.AAC.3
MAHVKQVWRALRASVARWAGVARKACVARIVSVWHVGHVWHAKQVWHVGQVWRSMRVFAANGWVRHGVPCSMRLKPAPPLPPAFMPTRMHASQACSPL